MRKSKITGREIAMIVILVVILVGTIYYLFFHFPYNAEMYSIQQQTNGAETEITQAMTKVQRKKNMEKELEEIFSRPAEEITEIAPYDNKEVVLNMLYGILAQTKDYSLSFQDPAVQEDGTVRRNISMSFSCDTYELAKGVIHDLTDSNWRCLVKNLSISGGEDLMKDPVNITVDITFFERAIIEEPEETTAPTVPEV